MLLSFSVSQFFNLSGTNCTDFETRFEDTLVMEILRWIINPYSDIEENEPNRSRGMEINNSGFKKTCTPPDLWNIARIFLVAFSCSYGVERGFSLCACLLTKKEKQTHRRLKIKPN